MTTNATKARKHGWRRAESWINGVLNPLLVTLPVELERLERGRVTVQLGLPGELVSILPIERYLGTAGRHILADFQAEHPASRKRFRRHDQLVAKLAEAACDALADLRGREEFVTAVGKLIRDDGENAADLVEEVNPWDFLAEYAVNNVGIVSVRSRGARLWNSHHRELLAHRRGAAFERLGASITELREADRDLIDWLARTRLKLCRDYDVPAADLGAPGE